MGTWSQLFALGLLIGLWTSATVVAATTCPHDINVTVIYNCMIWPDQDWKLVISQQLQNLVFIGLAECAKIHVVMSVPSTHPELAYDQLEHLLFEGREVVASILHLQHSPGTGGTVISQVHENSFEYPGLHLLWLLAQGVPSRHAETCLFLYFHSKGMVHHGHRASRDVAEQGLFNATITPWQEIMYTFSSDSTITRAGMFPSKAGWIWFNFWWARASYLQRVVEPMRTVRRHYYEDWLGRLYDLETERNDEPGRFENCSSCLSTRVPWGIGNMFDPGDIPPFN